MNSKKFGKRLLTILLCSVLSVSAVPVQAFADEESPDDYYAQAEER